MASKIEWDLIANDRSASHNFNKVGDAADRTDSKMHKLGRGAAVVGKALAVGLAAGVAVAGIAAKRFYDDARESERVTNLTASAIKATGGAAHVTAKQVGDLATSISNKTGVDDEAIQTGSNLLLTFKNVRNEVGRGNKIFNQATTAAVDLSAAGFGSIDSASKMLGKALNDPIAGITALSRAGVTFSTEQKETIKTMVETGNVLGAQKLIMKEVQSQVGGAAEATGTSMDKLKVRIGNAGEAIGLKLLPYVDKAADKFGGFITQMMNGEGAGGRLTSVLGQVGGVISKVSGFVGEMIPYFVRFGEYIMTNIVPVLKGVFTQALEGAQAAFSKIGDAIERNRPELESIAQTFTKVARIAGEILGPVIKLAFRIIGDNISMALDVIGLFWKGWQKVDQIVIPIIRGLATTFLNVVGMIIDGAAKALGWVPGLGGKLKGASDAFHEFKDDVVAAMNGVKDKTRGIGESVVAGIAAGIRRTTGLAVGAAGDMANRIAAATRQQLQVSSPSKVMEEIGVWVGKGFAKGIIGSTEADVSQALDNFLTKVGTATEKLKTKVDEQIGGIVNAHKGKLLGLAREAEQTKAAFDSIYGATASLDLTSLGKGEDGLISAGQLQADLNAKAAAAAQFDADIKALAKAGLAKSALADLAQRGAEVAGETARQLVLGGQQLIIQVNATEKALSKSGASVAKVGSAAFFDAGVETAKGLRQGFASQQDAIEDEMMKIAKHMQKAIKKALGIKSPSKVFEQVGHFTGLGLAAGIDGTRSIVDSSIAGLVTIPQPAGRSLVPLSTAAGANAADVTAVVNLVLDGTVIHQALLKVKRNKGGVSLELG